MDESVERITATLSELTTTELRKRLQNAGLLKGPITKTTRALFEKKLSQYIYEETHGKNTGDTELCAKQDSSNDSVLTNSHVISSDILCLPNNSIPPVDEATSVETDGEQKKFDNVIEEQTIHLTSPVEPTTGGGIFFGICIPASENTCDEFDSPPATHVYRDRIEVMKVMKRHKGARFKMFKTENEARKFSISHQDLSTSQTVGGRDIISSEEVPIEKSNNFKSLKRIDLVSLMKAIRRIDISTFKTLVWSNPRYLISSGDTPVILMEGPRYNALHIAAKDNVASLCSEILHTMKDNKFLSMMFADDTPTVLEERKHFLLDLYLNTPDKGQSETPLHFACKFGHIDVVEILVQHPLCDRGIRNKYGNTPRNVICERCDEEKLEDLKSTWSRDIISLNDLKSKISSLLDDSFYVPVFRTDGNSMQAVIGEPWSPDLTDKSTSPHMSMNPISPSLKVKAFAGPMSPQKANELHRNWKMPTKSAEERKRIQEIRRGDDEKGLERIGRNIAHTMDIPWNEYWSFLDTFVDLSTREGLKLLEDCLQLKFDKEDQLVQDLTESFREITVDDQDRNKAHDIDSDSSDCARNEASYTSSQPNNDGDNVTKIDIKTNSFGIKMDRNQCDTKQDWKFDALSKLNDLQELDIPISRTSQNKFLRRSIDHDTMILKNNRVNVCRVQPDLKDGIVIEETLNNTVKEHKSTFSSSSESTEVPNNSNLEITTGASLGKGYQSEINENILTNSHLCNNTPPGNCSTPQALESSLHTPTHCEHNSYATAGRFIEGSEPTKVDFNVYLALSGVIISDNYHNIIAWKKMVEGYTISDRKSWKTPIRGKSGNQHNWASRHHRVSPLVGGNPNVKSSHLSDPVQSSSNRIRLLADRGNTLHDVKGKLFEDV